MGRLMWLLVVCAAAGCGANYRFEAQRWAKAFDNPQTQYFKVKETQDRTGARLVRFASSFRTRDKRNNTVWGELYARQRPERGGIVLLPGGYGRLIVERTLAVALAERGYAVYLMYLPYTHLRAAEGARKRGMGGVLSTDMRRNEEIMVQTVRDARRAATMLQERYPHLKDRVGVLGLSLGGVMGAVAFASDDSFRAACLCLTGGQLAETLWSNSIFTARFKAELMKEGYTLPRLRHGLRKLEPTYYARPGKAQALLLVGARRDEAVKPSSVKALARAFGGARVTWIRGHHLQAVARLASKLNLIDIHFLLRLAPAAERPRPSGA